jgi:hypothetical protein
MSKKTVLCDDVECLFKTKRESSEKMIGECCFHVYDAVRFLFKTNVTICELGMGEKEPEYIRDDIVMDKYLRLKKGEEDDM